MVDAEGAGTPGCGLGCGVWSGLDCDDLETEPWMGPCCRDWHSTLLVGPVNNIDGEGLLARGNGQRPIVNK